MSDEFVDDRPWRREAGGMGLGGDRDFLARLCSSARPCNAKQFARAFRYALEQARIQDVIDVGGHGEVLE